MSERQYPVRRRDADLTRPGSFLEPFFSGSPWQVMRRMQEDMDRTFGQFFSGDLPAAGGMQWSPSVDVSSTEKEICLEADLPGVNKDDIEVTVRNHHLILRAEMREEKSEAEGERKYHRRERRYGAFERVLPLPEDVNEDQITCAFKSGVLTVHVPRTRVQKPEARRIEVHDADKIPAETAGGRSRSQAELDMTEDEDETADQTAGAEPVSPVNRQAMAT